MQKPVVGIIIGDPCGIGPEVVVRALASGRAHAVCHPVVIGSEVAVRRSLDSLKLRLDVRRISRPSERSNSAQIIDLIDTVSLDPAEIVPGRTSAACGAATGAWLQQADAFIESGEIAATVIGPVDTAAMKAAGVLHMLVPPELGQTYLLLASGKLRVAHLTDHIPLRDVCRLISADLVEKALVELDSSLRRWGIAAPRIGVSGLNPHAAGEEEQREIAPGVLRAKRRGIHAEGPVSPDAVFRQCIEDKYDAVLAMFHDQGHIAIKTWGFAGNSVIVLGTPRLLVSVAHGTAHDIVGLGVADSSMMENAIDLAGSLAAGQGFPPN